jgi:hypothetical protein
MRILRIILSVLLVAAFTLTPPTEPPAEEYGIALLNLHTFHTVTSFGFVDHHARVNVDFTGYDDDTEIRIDVEIRKQGWFALRPIVSETYYAEGESYQDEFFYPILRDGTYDCTVTYTVVNGNEKDLITFEDTRDYRLSEHTEHTHVWNYERIEPTHAEDGLERTFCYCGVTEGIVLEKLPYSHNSGSNNDQSSSSSGVGATGNYNQYTSTSFSTNSSPYIQSNISSNLNSSSNCTHFGAPCNSSGSGRCVRSTPSCKNGKIFGTPCNLSGKCVGGSCLIPTR